MLELIAGVNSYVTQAEADAYLAGSIQWASEWAALSDEAKALALVSAFRSLEREGWAGEATDADIVTAAAVSVGGAGYAVGDVLRLEGGTWGEPCIVEVVTETAGAVDTVKILSTGAFSALAPDPAPSVALSGTGVGATFDRTTGAQVAEWPRTITDCGELNVDPLVIPSDLKAAQCELAAIFNADPSAAANVGAGAAGTGSNIQKVEAGSAKVTYFRPTEGTIYPTIVWQLMSGYREGACASSSVGIGGAATGTGDVSAFTCPDERYGLNSGYA